MEKKYTYEIYWLRCISCLAVVAIHAISSGVYLYSEDASAMSQNFLYAIQMGLMFGTPAFIFISEFLIAKSYPNGLPDGFFRKRIKFILVPYLVMSVVYAIIFVETSSISAIFVQSLRNAFLGDFVGYFILIIFQFYILHYLLHKKLKDWKPKKVIGITLIINILYLAFFNFVPEPGSGSFSYFWSRGFWMLMPGWLFYFSLGYYTGKYYNTVIKFINRHKLFIIIMPVFLFLVVVVLRYLELPDSTSSKRIDVIFYTTSMIFLIMFVSSKIKKAPNIVLFISKYSFSIYLLHKLVVDTFGRLSDNIFTHTILLFLIGIIFSIVVSSLVNKIPYGELIVGKLGRVPTSKNQSY